MSLFRKYIPIGAAKVAKVAKVEKSNTLVDVQPQVDLQSVPAPDAEKLAIWVPEPHAKIVDGELRLLGTVRDLAETITGLTGNDIELQKTLLRQCCQKFAPTHFWALQKQWEEKAAILEYDSGLNRAEAEVLAAEMCNLKAFLPMLQTKTQDQQEPTF